MWRYLVIVVILGCNACGDLQPLPTSPSSSPDLLSQEISTAHYVFRFASGDSVDSAAQEAFHDWISPRLGIELPRRIEYRKYRNREHMGALEGIRNTNGIANPDTLTLFTIAALDTHEATHLYVSTWAKHSVALLSEGLAMAHTVDPRMNNGVPLWNNTALDTVVRTLATSGQRPRLAQIASTTAFRQLPDSVTYPVSGSFVRFLIDTRGAGPMRELYVGTAPESGASELRVNVTRIYGEPLESLEQRWLGTIGVTTGTVLQ